MKRNSVKNVIITQLPLLQLPFPLFPVTEMKVKQSIDERRSFFMIVAQWAKTIYQAVIGESKFFEFDSLGQNLVHSKQNPQRIWFLGQKQKF